MKHIKNKNNTEIVFYNFDLKKSEIFLKNFFLKRVKYANFVLYVTKARFELA
jgi:hypothetical protein